MKSFVERGVWRSIGGLSLIIWLAGTVCLEAQVVKILDYTNTFRYNETDNLNAVDWTARTYDDATGNWAGGMALLAYERNPAITPMIRTTLGDPSYYVPIFHAVYFRAHFDNAFGAKAFLTLSNRIDDGAVFYLNGVEIRRVRVTVNPNPPTFTSFATATSTEGAEDVFTFVATNLVNDDNVLAAIVLQSGVYGDLSFDTVYGTIMWSENIVPVAITTQPVSVAARVNDSVSFTVAASGWLPTYQWQFRANTNVAFANVAGATNATHAIGTVTSTDAGFFQVIVSNPQNTVTSSVAALTVAADISPPELVSALASDTTNQIVVTFNENVLGPTATNVNNYLITIVGGTNRLVVTNAAVNARTVRLMVTPLLAVGSNYVLTVNDVFDTEGNSITTDARIGIASWRDILPLDHAWNWSDAGVDLGSNWSAPGYNESTNTLWALANPGFYPVTKALFYATYLSLPGPKNTSITIGAPTYYFRTRFVLPPGTPPFGSLRFSHVVDDGAVFYLNGQEVYRYNMPVGSVSFSSLAAASISNPTLITSTNLAVTNLVAGTNVLAVETHVSSMDTRTDATVVFGTAMRAAYAPDAGAVAPPRLAVGREANREVVISWEGNGFVLQSAPTPLGAWTSLPQASSPRTNVVTEAQQFFRLKQ